MTVGDGGCGKRKRGCVGSGDVGVEGGDGFVKQLNIVILVNVLINSFQFAVQR